MRNSLLICTAALFVAPVSAQTKYKLFASDSVSISRTAPNVFNDNRLRAYNSTYTYADVVGLYKFDLSQVPPSKIQSMTLTLYMENAFGSPRNNPVVNLHYSADDKWTRATATATSGAPGPVVTPNVTNFMHPKHVFKIDVTKHNFLLDLIDNAVTFVIDNVNPAYSYVYFYGHTGSPAGPNAELEIVTGACKGTVQAYGVGGKDSTNTVVAMSSSGCPDLGQTFSVGTQLGAANTAPILLFMGASKTKWLGLTLPLELTFLGAPGNHVYASLDAFLGPIPNPGGGGAISLPIPNTPVFANQTFYFQSLVIDSKANKFGVAFANGLEVTLR